MFAMLLQANKISTGYQDGFKDYMSFAVTFATGPPFVSNFQKAKPAKP